MIIPYYKNDLITLYHGDCLEIMPQLDIKFDCCITDLPYGKHKNRNQCKWDSIIPFEPMWNKLKRLIKDNGSICLFGNEPFSSYLRCSNMDMFKYDQYWNKKSTSGFMNAKYLPMKTIEIISVFSKANTNHSSDNNMVYLPQDLIPCNKISKNGNKSNGAFNTPYWKPDVKYVQNFTNYPKNYIEIPYQKNTFHPTQKPVKLIEYLIKTYTNENECVLDFTAGSGTTGIACMNLNRKCVLIEKEEKYCKIIIKRLQDKEDEIKQRIF